jgi:hypothetical protein
MKITKSFRDIDNLGKFKVTGKFTWMVTIVFSHLPPNVS